MSVYCEDEFATKENRQEYVSEILAMLNNEQRKAQFKRDEYIADIKTSPESYREDFIKMLGWPLTDYTPEDIPKFQKTLLFQDDEMYLYRVTIFILDNIPVSGLLFLHKEEKLPLVLVQHGGAGTPELCGSIYECGSSNYNDFLERTFKLGANVLALQLLLWDQEKYDVPFNRGNIDASLKQLGGSVAALEIYGIRKAIDAVCAEGIADPKAIGMAGLSYGGFYTLFTAAVEKRINSAISCSFFNDRNIYSWQDFTWKNSAEKFLDAEIALLVYPRKLLIALGKQDDLFRYEDAESEIERLNFLSKQFYNDNEWLKIIPFEGTHEFFKTDGEIIQMIEEIRKNEKTD